MPQLPNRTQSTHHHAPEGRSWERSTGPALLRDGTSLPGQSTGPRGAPGAVRRAGAPTWVPRQLDCAGYSQKAQKRVEGRHTLLPVICHKCVSPPRLTGRVTARCLTSVGLVLTGASQAPVPAPASFFPPPLKSPSCLSMGTLRVLELQTPQASSTESLKIRCTQNPQFLEARPRGG